MRFESNSLFDFTQKFRTTSDCKKYLFENKYKDGFICTKCGHTQAWNGTKEYTLICKNCRKIHSVTQNTIFHEIRFDLLKAFYIIFEISTSSKSMSALQISKRYSINKNTAWLFMRKYRKALESSETKPMGVDEGSKVYVDEFVVGGYEIGKTGRSGNSKKRKMVVAVETTENNKIKRVYGLRINNYTTSELRRIFDKHIAHSAEVYTDGFSAYNPVASEWNMYTDMYKMKKSTHPMNIVIQQFKSWIRGIHHHVSAPHIQEYMNEFSFRINRSLWKDVCFHSAILKGLVAQPLLAKNIPTKAQFSV